MTNQLNIFGIVGKDVTKETVQKAMAEFADNNDLLKVYIDCDGGSVTEGMAIIDLLQAYPGKPILLCRVRRFRWGPRSRFRVIAARSLATES